MPPAKHPTVLVADSYEDTRFLLKHWLEAEGYEVVEAGIANAEFPRPWTRY